MGRAAALSFALVLIAIVISAHAEISPFTVARATSTLVEEGTISVSGGSFREVQINVSLPQTGGSQKATFDDTYSIYTDAEGNLRATISKTTREREFDYKITSTVETNAVSTTSLPETFVSPSEYAKYLAASQKVQSDDEAIRALALKITENATDSFEKIAHLAVWVNSNLEYQSDLVGQENDALWVLANRRGVCVEYTTLFVALCRSIGIPARYVTGYAYANKFNAWLGHAWAEAYIGKWVPVDPTWLEVGNLDAMHIATSRSDYLKPDLLVSALVYPPEAKLVINRKGDRGGVSDAIKTELAASLPDDFDYEFDTSTPEAGIGDSMLVWAYRASNDYRVMPVILSECKGGPFDVNSAPEQHLFVEPGKGRVAMWEINTPAELSKRFVYTCPLVLNSPYLGAKRLNLTVSNSMKLGDAPEAWAEAKTVRLGQLQKIYVRGDGSLFGIKLVTPEGIFENPKDDGDLSVFAIKPEVAGRQDVFVVSKGRNYQKISYNVQKENGTVFIENYSIPKLAFESMPFKFSVTVGTSDPGPKHVQLTATLGDETVSKSGVVQKSGAFEFELVPKKSGHYLLSIELSADGVRDGKTYPVQVAVPPKVFISKVEQQQADGMQKITVTLRREGSPSDISISLNSHSKAVAAGLDSAEFELAPGSYPIVVRWEDETGKGYQIADTLAVKNITGGLPFIPSDGNGGPKCMTGMILAAMAVFVFARS